MTDLPLCFLSVARCEVVETNMSPPVASMYLPTAKAIRSVSCSLPQALTYLLTAHSMHSSLRVAAFRLNIRAGCKCDAVRHLLTARGLDVLADGTLDALVTASAIDVVANSAVDAVCSIIVQRLSQWYAARHTVPLRSVAIEACRANASSALTYSDD